MKSFWNKVLDLFFPPHCVACGKIGAFICPACDGKIVPLKKQTCPFCNQLSERGKTCPRCRAKNPLTGATAYGYFKDPILKKAIWDLKYQKLSAIAPTLAEKVITKIESEKLAFDLVAAVPVSKKRQTWRGFNQSDLLAREIAQHFEKPTFFELKRIKETKTQVGLKRRERQKNLTGAFRVTDPQKVLAGKRVLLVDDVITTGSTLNECARVLRQAGAKIVWAALVAKE